MFMRLINENREVLTNWDCRLHRRSVVKQRFNRPTRRATRHFVTSTILNRALPSIMWA
jgi:hypothetical protein